MQVIRGLHNLKSQVIGGSVATIGNYDGLHLGHQQIIEIVKKKAQELKLPTLVIIFEPQPGEFFAGDRFCRLSSLREKLAFLRDSDIDWVLTLPFNERFSKISALDFVKKIMLDSLKIRHLVVGDDFTFGCERRGDFSLLEQVAASNGFQVTRIAPFKIDDARVSSSLIRSFLVKGDLNSAAKFLGRKYQVTGKVVRGDHLGHSIGFPTANIHLKKRNLPLSGVYLAKVYDVMQAPLWGLANVGFRPTVGGEKKMFEVYILDFTDNIYQKRVKVEFYEKIRDEKKFSSLEQLKLQIKEDLLMAESLLK